MRTRGSLVVALAVVAVTLLPAGTADAVTTRRLDQAYTIGTTLDVAGGRLDATQTIDLTNRASNAIDHLDLSVIPRALGSFTLESVDVAGGPASAEWTTTTNLRVSLPSAVAPGASVSLVIGFSLVVGRSADAFTARLSQENGVLSFGEWFPIVSREHDVYGIGDPQLSFTADTIRLELATTAPQPRDAVACPGLVTAPEATGTEWVCESTDVRDFSFVVNPRFRLTTRTMGEVELRVYTETVSGAATADLAGAAFEGMTDAFGPYPWSDLVIAEVGSGGGFSMEYPRAIHLTRGKVTDPYVINHEVAHQWFYAQVGNDQMREPWLDEAFADFSARYLMGIGENQCSTRPVDSQVFAWEAGPISGGDWTSCDGYFHAVFYQGTEFLNAVRAAMGDEAFFGAMRDFVADHQFDVVTGRRLLRHLSGRTDADLEPIFARYLAEYRPMAARKVVRDATQPGSSQRLR